MKKVFTKIAGLSVGLALAIGVGVAVGSKEAKVAKAADVLAYTLDGTVTGGSSGYDSESSITQGDYSWKVTGNTTMNPWRIGGKSLTGVDRTLYSTTAFSDTISKVELTVGSASSITVNSLTLDVASDGDFSTVVESVSKTFAANSTITFDSSEDWTNCYYKITFNVTVSGTSNKFVQVSSVEFYKESSTPRGEIEIGDVSPVITVGDSDSLSYTWTPASGSSATIISHTWVSSDPTVLSISGDTYTAAAPGVVTLTLNATDSISEEYSVQTGKIYVTNDYTFEIGDNVALYASGVTKELSGIGGDKTKYGLGADYSTQPTGLYALTVEAGTETGTFAFKNSDSYLSWSSDNSLDKSPAKSINTSWYVVEYDDYMLISNAAKTTRQIWWNNGASSLRFACYEGKTTETSGYNSVSLAVIEDVPVRGTIAITAPTETLLRQGASATATFSWTAPEEAPSTTIASHTWTSSDTAVFSVSGDTYTAVGEGKAKLILNATDSNGQEYTASTKDITIVGVVSGTYEKKYNVVEGDTVAIVCEADETEFSGMSSAGAYSTYVFYNDAPASIYDFVLEEGSADGSFALKTSDSKYLAWTKSGAADIGLVDEIQENSSWTIEFENGNAKIANCALDGESHRYLAWNHGSPRFAAYKTGQTAIQLYAPATVIEESAVTFANLVINDLTCDATGKTAPSTSEWEGLEDAYSAVTAAGKTQLKEIFAVHHESPATDKEVLEEAMAKYDYVVGKYGSSVYADFIERDPAPIPSGRISDLSIEAGNNTMLIVVVIASVSALAFTTLLVFKKKKQK